MRNLQLTLAYDGTDFHGWQIQPNTRTIQGQLTQVIERILQEKITLYGSGRTDAGVHAMAQVANFKTHSSLPCKHLQEGLNGCLPPSIRVRNIKEVNAKFHARYDVYAKTYRYRIWRDHICPPSIWRYVEHLSYPLDLEAMKTAAKLFEGEIDFFSFASSGRQGKKIKRKLPERSCLRKVFRSQILLRSRIPLLIYEICGSGFLHRMVRNIMGALLEVGRRRLKPEDISRIIAARDRSSSCPSVSAKGLVLVRVDYHG